MHPVLITKQMDMPEMYLGRPQPYEFESDFYRDAMYINGSGVGD